MSEPGFRGSGFKRRNRNRYRENAENEDSTPAPTVQLLTRRPDTPATATLPGAPATSTTTTATTTATTTTTSSSTQASALNVLLARPKTSDLPSSSSISSPPPSSSSTRQGLRRHVVAAALERGSEPKGSPRGGTSGSGSGVSCDQQAGVPVMRDAVRCLSDSNEMLDHFSEFASETNTSFRVIGAIGPQTSGKSTVLSMLAGNQPMDMYRQYVFRPSSREALETSRHQSTKIYIYVSRGRNIFVDCQANNCASILEELLIHSRHSRQPETTVQADSVQLISWMQHVCHTLVVCHDWFVDIDLIRLIRAAELLRAAVDKANALCWIADQTFFLLSSSVLLRAILASILLYVGNSQSLPELCVSRRTNLVFVHTRAKAVDFSPAARSARVRLLRCLFADSLRLRLPEDANNGRRGSGDGALWTPPSDVVYFPLADIKPRPDLSAPEHGHHHGRSGGATGGGGGGPGRGGPSTSVSAEDASRTKDEIYSGVVDFDDGVKRLKRLVLRLPVEDFVSNRGGGDQEKLTEKQWYQYARGIWTNDAFRHATTTLSTRIGKMPSGGGAKQGGGRRLEGDLATMRLAADEGDEEEEGEREGGGGGGEGARRRTRRGGAAAARRMLARAEDSD